MPVSELNRAVLRTVVYARSISPNTTAVHVTDDRAEGNILMALWDKWLPDVPLVILESPFRSLMEPLLAYVDALDQQDPGTLVTVVLPEYVPSHWWQQLLHNQSALRLKAALLFRHNTIVTNVPYHDLENDEDSF